MKTDRIFVELPGHKAAAAPWGSLRLIDFNLVHSLEVRTALWRRVPVQDLHLHLAAQDGSSHLRIHVCFRGVRNVEILNTRQVYLCLYDVSSRGWEDVFYEAEDFEDGGFKLMCRDIDLMSISVDLGVKNLTD